MEHDASQIGSRIREARESAGLTQREAAKRIGADQVTLSRWELGKQRIAAENLAKLGQAYGVSVDWLMAAGEHAPRRGARPPPYQVAEAFRLPASIEATLRRFEADALDADVPIDQIEQVVAAVRGPLEYAVKRLSMTESPGRGDALADLVRSITEELHAFLEATHRLATGGVGRERDGAPPKKKR
jgi:transcriptional regulator with XRE-family HTH domain